MILYFWAGLLSVFIGSYGFYFAYLRYRAKGSWGLQIDSQFCPSLSILVPAFNEEKLIVSKLENLKEVSYPKDKMEVILVDDASTDQTLAKVEEFVRGNGDFHIKIMHQAQRQGKAVGLNAALNTCSNGLIVVTDADAFWPPDVLHKAMPYLSDSSVGALSGLAGVKNSGESWVTNAETNYLSMMSIWRLGESKIHSTIRFEGSFCAFRRSAFREFDWQSGADDSGTALQIIQNGYRAILAPEVLIQAHMPSNFRDRAQAKTRRAVHLTGLWVNCLRLLANRRLKLPKKIALPEIFLSLFVPFIFVALFCSTFLLFLYYPVPVLFFVGAICLVGLIPRIGTYVFQGIMDQFILFYAIILYAMKKRYITWESTRQ